MLSFEKWQRWLEAQAAELRVTCIDVRFFVPSPKIKTAKPSTGIQFRAEKTICDFSLWVTGECDWTVHLMVGPKELEMVSHKWGLLVSDETFEATFAEFLAQFRLYEAREQTSRLEG